MNTKAFLICVLGVVAAPLAAQETRTICREVGSRTVCDTKPRKPTPTYGDVFRNLREANAKEAAAQEEYARDTLAFSLYAQRAVAVLWDTIEDMGLDSALAKGFVQDAKPVILSLYRVNPKATNSEISDAYYPLVRKYRNRQ
jgi:hypothetical protein